MKIFSSENNEAIKMMEIWICDFVSFTYTVLKTFSNPMMSSFSSFVCINYRLVYRDLVSF